MMSPLLITKLNRPALRPDLVRRPQLIARLNASLNRKLTLVSAPAGFGKTTLIAEWLSGINRPATWLLLDETDNDLTRFLTSVVTTLRQVEPAIDQPDHTVFHPSIKSILTSVINQIAASTYEFILVLDDYHLITAQPVHQAVAFLLDHLPDNLHLVTITRADPPLLLGRLRGRGQLTELRQADLCFTLGEVRIFVDQVLGSSLPDQDVEALAARTEGWIAGLQMATLAMQSLIFQQEPDNQRISRFVRAFSGSNRYIMDYLGEEVLQQQPESVQSFLLQTAILNQLTAPLCNAVTGQTDSQSTLEMLERSNLFIFPLDDERGWYRYHQLFADLLRHQLRQRHQSPPATGKEPEAIARLHIRASQWYEHNGFTSEAIKHAFSALDFGRAADLIEQAARATLIRSEITTFLAWVERLPAGLFRSRPTLEFYQVWALLLSGQVDRAVENFESLADQPDRPAGQITLLRAFITLSQGDLTRALDLCQQALAALDNDDLFWRGFSNWIFSTFYLMGTGDLNQSGQTLAELARISRESDHLMAAVAILNQLGALYVRQAQLHRAQATYREAQTLATSDRRQPLPIAGEALMGLGELWREWNDLERAARYLQDGIALTDQWREAAAYPGFISLARVKQAQGNSVAALAAMQQARERVEQFDPLSGLAPYLAAHQAQLWLLQGNINATAQWAAAIGFLLDESGSLAHDSGFSDAPRTDDLVTYHLRKYEHIVLARLLLARNHPAAALALLDPLLLQMEQQGRTGMTIEGLILKALALQAQDNLDQALSVLEQALSLAQPEGYVRLFVDEGIPLARLMARRQEDEDSRHINKYVRQLLAAFGLAAAPTEPLATQLLVDPLSERELEVLRLMATGLKYKEIASRLNISLNTVRHHVKNLYGKLNVNSRTQAIVQAQELGLL